jgi:hypothetical protein
MITTEQIDIFWNALKECNRAKTQRETESIIQDAIERYEQSKWSRFDVNDKTTYPKLHKDVVIDQEFCAAFSGDTWYTDDHDLADQNVTYWMPLPEFKERSDESN